MSVLNIRIQGTNPSSFPERNVARYLEQIRDSEKPVVLTLSAIYEGKYQPEVVELVRNIASGGNCSIGQQGCFGARCKAKHLLTDPWHENACLYPWNKAPSKEEQQETMKRGREVIERIAGVSPVFFAPSNHLYNEDTLEAAANNGYKYFGERAFIPLPAYKISSLIVVPEASLEKRRVIEAPSYYAHYDRIFERGVDLAGALDKANALSELKPVDLVPVNLIRINNRMKIIWKVSRDLAGMPKKLRRLIK